MSLWFLNYYPCARNTPSPCDLDVALELLAAFVWNRALSSEIKISSGIAPKKIPRSILPEPGHCRRFLCHPGFLYNGLMVGYKLQGLPVYDSHGTTESGAEIEANDPNWDRLQSVAREARVHPRAWLAMNGVCGAVGRNERFAATFSAALGAVGQEGVETALQRYSDHQ